MMTKNKENESVKSKIAASLSLMLIGATLAAPAALAADAKEQAEMEVRPVKIKSPLIPVALDKTLPNGLRLVVSEDHSAPVASIAIVYDVGARDEKKTRSGFARKMWARWIILSISRASAARSMPLLTRTLLIILKKSLPTRSSSASGWSPIGCVVSR